MDDCVFCGVVAGLGQDALWQDEEFAAFLDLNPYIPGQTLVVPKKHYDSNFFELEDEMIEKTMKAAKKVAKKLNLALGTDRVCSVVEGLGVGHLHVKLYPVISAQVKEGLVPLGKRAQADELNLIAEKIRKVGDF